MGMIQIISSLGPPPSTGGGGSGSGLGTITWTGKTNHFFGDSITAGVGASVSTNRWATVLSTAKGSTEHNYGISGQVMQSIDCGGRTQFQPSTIPIYDSVNDLFIYFNLGVNDQDLIASCGFSPSGYTTKYLSVIDAARAKGWPLNRIVVMTPFYVIPSNTTADADKEAYAAAARSVAATKHTVLVDIFEYMKNYPFTNVQIPDGTHDGDAGCALIAAFLGDLSNYVLQ